MLSLANVDSDAIWAILARLAWQGNMYKAPENPVPGLLPPCSTLFPQRNLQSAHPKGLAPVAAALLEKVEQLPPSWQSKADVQRLKHVYVMTCGKITERVVCPAQWSSKTFSIAVRLLDRRCKHRTRIRSIQLKQWRLKPQCTDL